MKAICLAFNDLDFIIYPFQDSRMDWMIAMVQDAVTIAIQHFGEFRDGPLPEGPG